MAITSISRLQQRRGLKVDLPARLHEAEFGWCIDTRELFIGNGQGFNGNSQILSQWSQNDQLISHVYRGSTSIPATTGALPDTPIIRPIGAIFDDVVSVKAYGAQGDGVTDDTESIQRAINDVWKTMAPNPGGQASLRAIIFPAGNYLISNTIYIAPNVGLIGEGVGRTVIIMGTNINNPACLISTQDSLAQTGANIGLLNAVLPNNILVKGMTLNASLFSTLDGIDLQRASKVQIEDVTVIGAWQPGQNPIAQSVKITNGIIIQTLGTLYLADTIRITNYSVQNMGGGLYCNDPARYIVVDNFDINTCFRGAVFEPNVHNSTNGASYVRFVNGTFRNIDWYGLYASGSNNGVTSCNNTYDKVGDFYNAPPIMFEAATSGCSSINDTFSVQGRPRIVLGNPYDNILISPQQVSINSNQPIALGPVELLDGATDASTGISYLGTLYSTVFIEYSIVRGMARRTGRLMLSTDGVNVDFDDYGVDLNAVMHGTVGVIWSANVVAGAAVLNYATSTTGTNATLTYIETKW